MWGLRFMMTRLSEKMWGIDGGGQEEYVLKSIVFVYQTDHPSIICTNWQA